MKIKEETAKQIAMATTAMGITTEQAATNATILATRLHDLTCDTPEQLKSEIICIQMNPSLYWWQKLKLIWKLEKQIKEKEKNT